MTLWIFSIISGAVASAGCPLYGSSLVLARPITAHFKCNKPMLNSCMWKRTPEVKSLSVFISFAFKPVLQCCTLRLHIGIAWNFIFLIRDITDSVWETVSHTNITKVCIPLYHICMTVLHTNIAMLRVSIAYRYQLPAVQSSIAYCYCLLVLFIVIAYRYRGCACQYCNGDYQCCGITR